MALVVIFALATMISVDVYAQDKGKTKEGKTYISPTMGAKFVLIPAGTFTMGSLEERYEVPPHKVTISKPFYMQTTEVTQGQWKKVMGSNPSHFSSCGDDCPVEQVSYVDIPEFIKKLNEMEGTNKYRLPTEAQWEYSARSGEKQEKYAGTSSESDLGDYAWYARNSGKMTHPVGQKKPNRLGLYDMSGNVGEMVKDWSGRYYGGNSTDPQGPISGNSRVVRGGYFGHYEGGCRTSSRDSLSYGRSLYTGFRLVRMIHPDPDVDRSASGNEDGAVAAIPWEKNELVNHTMKLQYKILKSTKNMEGPDELYVFHDNGIAIIFLEGYVDLLRGVLYKWHIDPVGTLILKSKSGKGEISLKKISSKGDAIEVLTWGMPALATMIKHPPTIPWSREEIENNSLDLPTSSERIESYFFSDTGSGGVKLGSKAAIAPLAMRWDIDPFGTLIVTDGPDIVMRKISSKGNTIEVLRNGEPVVYDKIKVFSRWVYNLMTVLIYIVPILIVVIVVAVIIWLVDRKKRLLPPESK